MLLLLLGETPVARYDPVAGAIHAVCKTPMHDKNMKRYEALVGHPQHRLAEYSDYAALPEPAKMLLLRDMDEGGPPSILQEVWCCATIQPTHELRAGSNSEQALIDLF